MRTHDPIDFQAAISEAAQRISAEVAAAVDLYVLEQGPLRLEQDERGYKFVARQEVRLRLKEAEEIRAEERERAAKRVAAAKAEFIRITDAADDSWVCRVYDDAVAAARGAEQ